ncbi:MAG TPA: hypothetical protein VLG50_07170 [Candidatus Saccharimonadales bacterium]|nr:hypothetical protein [Candidatus Saccharimonadales bacterium]
MSLLYLHYIAYYIKNLEPTRPRSKYITMFYNCLKTSYFTTAPKAKLRQLALQLYYRHVLSLLIKATIPDELSSEQLKTMIHDFELIFKNYQLNISFVYYTEDDKVLDHVKQFSESIDIIKSMEPEMDKNKLGHMYTVTELRKLAADKQIAGRAKMNKVQLCKALKINY